MSTSRMIISALIFTACQRPAAPQPLDLAAPAAAAPSAGSTRLDNPLARQVRRTAEQCNIEDFGYWEDCPKDDLKIELQAIDNQDFGAALKTYCALLDDPDREVVWVALDRLSWTMTVLPDDTDASTLDAELIDCLFARFERPPGAIAPHVRLLAGILASYGAGGGREDAILAALTAHADPSVRAHGFAGLGRFTGMRLWPRLSLILEESDDDDVRQAILGHVAEFAFPPAGPERAALCDAFVTHAVDRSLAVAGVAASRLSYNCPEKAPELFAATRTMQERAAVSRDHVLAVRQFVISGETPGRATIAGALAVLEAIVADAKLTGGVREAALLAVSNHDEPRGRALAARYRDDGDPQVAGAARYLLAPPP